MIRGAVGWLIAHPRLTALLGAFAISFSGILYRLSATSPETAAFFRCLYALPILFIATWIERREGGAGAMTRRSVWIAVGAGILFAVDIIFWHRAVDQVGAGLATVLGNLQVVIVGVGAWVLFGERPSNRAFLALPIVLLGIVLISGVLTQNSYGANPALGAGLGIVAAFAYAFYLLIIRRIGRRRAAEPVAISTTSTAIVCLLAGLGLGTMDLVPSLPAHFWLVLLALSAQSAGYLLIGLSLPRLPSVVTSIILLAQPVLSVIFAVLLIGETPSLGQFAGVALLLGGIALATVPIPGARPWSRRRALAEAGPADLP